MMKILLKRRGLSGEQFPTYLSVNLIASWFRSAKAVGAGYMLVVYDSLNEHYYPPRILPGDDCWAIIDGLNDTEGREVKEVYDLSMNMGEQLAEYRAWHPPERKH